jgi:PAS domain S-box-containing protein
MSHSHSARDAAEPEIRDLVPAEANGDPRGGGDGERPSDPGVPHLSLDALPEALFVLDSSATILHANRLACELVGRPVQRLRGSALASLLARGDGERLAAAVAAALDGSGRQHCRGVRLDGEPPVVADLAIQPTGSPDAPVVACARSAPTSQPVSGAAGADDLFRRLFDDDITGDFVSTPEGRLLACNAAFAEILGYDSVEEAMRVPAQAYYLDPAVRETLIRRLRQAGRLKRLELDLRRRDGRPVHVILNVAGTFDASGRLESLQGSLFDITEHRRLADERTQLLVRERAARAIAEAAERHAAFLAEVGSALDSSLDYRSTLAKLARLVVPTLADYCLIDERTPDGGSRRVAVAHVDPSREPLLLPEEENLPDADPTRHPVLEVLQSGRAALVAEVSAEKLGRIAHDAEHLEVLRALELRSYMVVPLRARERTLGALTLASSVSGRRYSKRDLELAEAVADRAALAVDNARLYGRARQAARTREEVLAFVSHDLRNPLATILLNASALMETIPPERLRPEEREQLEWIARSSEQMNRMIRDLLDVARIDSGGLPLSRAPTEIGHLLRDAWRLLEPLAREKGLGLEVVEAPPGPPAIVDRERCLRVLSNLIGNAIQFTPEGGRVRIRAEAADGMYRISVADNGIGIAAEDAGRLFEPYWQGRRSLGGRHGGSGLGLAIAKGIVEAHGGSIWFQSEPGEGTTFFFTVPHAPGRVAGGSAEPDGDLSVPG